LKGRTMLDFTNEAFDEFTNMRNHVLMIRNFYGLESPEFIKVSESFNNVVYNMVRLGGRIFRDGNLSLIAANDFITYGIVWFGNNDIYDGPEVGEWSIHS